MIDPTKNVTAYRPDIDGLRAVAVLAVLVFHCFPTFLSGGFVGVDVFFVISGYLIGRSSFDEMAAGNYSASAYFGRHAVLRNGSKSSMMSIFSMAFISKWRKPAWLDR